MTIDSILMFDVKKVTEAWYQDEADPFNLMHECELNQSFETEVTQLGYWSCGCGAVLWNLGDMINTRFEEEGAYETT